MRGPNPNEYVSTRMPIRRASTRCPASWAAIKSPRPTTATTMAMKAGSIADARDRRRNYVVLGTTPLGVCHAQDPDRVGKHAAGAGVLFAEAGRQARRLRARAAERVPDGAGGRGAHRGRPRARCGFPVARERGGRAVAAGGGEERAGRRRRAAEAGPGGTRPLEEAVRR